MFEDSVSSSIPSVWSFMNSWLTPTVLFVLLNLMIGTIAITSTLGTNKHHEQGENHEHHPQTGQLARSPSVLQMLKSINFYSYRSQEPTTACQRSTPETETHYTFGYAQEPEQPKLTRSPSILQRLKSFNPYNYIPYELTPSQFSTTTVTTLQENQEPVTHYDFQQTRVGEQPRKQPFEEEDELDGHVGEDHFPYEGEEQTKTIDEIYNQLKGGQMSRSKSDTQPTAGQVPKKLPKKMKKSASSKSAFGHIKEVDIVERRRPTTVKEGKASKATEAEEEVDARADDFINKFKHQLKLQRLDSILRYKEMINRGSAK